MRTKYPAKLRAQMSDRCDSLNVVARAFDRPFSSIFGQVAPTGGIRPALNQRSGIVLTHS